MRASRSAALFIALIFPGVLGSSALIARSNRVTGQPAAAKPKTFEGRFSKISSGTLSGSATSGNAALQSSPALLASKVFFERNDGQTDRRVLYLSHGLGHTLYFTRTGVTFAMARRQGEASAADYFRIEFSGANPHSRAEGVEELAGKSNYFAGPDAAQWHTQIPQFAKVRYANLYPGIDLIFYSREGHLEYDIDVAPGADLSAVRLKIEGSDASLSRQGDVLVATSASEPIQMRKPYAYQPGAKLRTVRAAYTLKDRELSFAVRGYDQRRPLVIDPALIFSTFLSSNCANCADTIADFAVDSTGIYLTGSTTGTEFPVNGSGQGPSVTGAAFVLKLDPTGSQIIYETFLSNADGTAVAVDGSQSAYVTGTVIEPTPAGSAAFPLTAGVFSNRVPASSFLHIPFATKLSADGSQLIYSTLLQQPTPDGSAAANAQVITPGRIAVDSQGALYVTGSTVLAINVLETSSMWMPLPVTQGAFQTTPGKSFVMKLTPNASGFDYSTYIDDAVGSNVSGIAIDGNGDAFLTGSTTAGFPTTSGVYQPSSGTGYTSAFVSEFNPSGTAQVYSTLFSPSGPVNASSNAIALDTLGDAVIVGPAYIAKFNATGTSLLDERTLPGGAEGDDVVVDSSGDAYVVGSTSVPATSTLVNPIQSYFGAPSLGNSTIAMKADTNSGTVLWSTFLGQEGQNGCGGCRIQIDSLGAAYLLIASSTFPGTSGQVGLSAPGVSRSLGADLLLKIAPSLGAPVPLASPRALTFTGQALGTPSASMDVQVGNFGDALMSPTVSISGDFSETDNCAGSVAGGQKCDVNVVFTPTATGTRSGLLTLSFGNGIAQQTVSLTGNGTGPAVTLSPASLSFGVQSTGTTSGAQQVTVTNSGTGTLSISSIQTAAPFAATNACGAPITPGNSCTIQVTFTPTSSGTQTGTLTITDNAPSSPQSVSLAGNQPASFSLSSTGGAGSTSLTVAPGQNATYGLSVAGSNGFSGTVSFACSGAPTNATCSVSPNPATISGASAVGVTVTVATQAASATGPTGSFRRNVPWTTGIMGIAAFTAVILGFLSFGFATRRRQSWSFPAWIGMAVLLACAGCGGGNSSSSNSSGSASSGSGSTTGNSATPAGQYTLTVTAMGGSVTQSMNLSLTVN